MAGTILGIVKLLCTKPELRRAATGFYNKNLTKIMPGAALKGPNQLPNVDKPILRQNPQRDSIDEVADNLADNTSPVVTGA